MNISLHGISQNNDDHLVVHISSLSIIQLILLGYMVPVARKLTYK